MTSTPDTAPTTPDARKRPTMGDVAARVGVSRQLVSLVFRNAPGASAETRERVLRAADELGYQPDTAARVLRRARSGHIGVLFTMRHPHDVALVEAIYPAAERMGYDIALGATGPSRDERKAVENLLAYRVEGLIVIGPYIDATAMAQLAQRIPIVEISRRMDVAGVDSVRTADDKGVRQAVDHLVDLGHNPIAYVDGGAMPGANERRRGYRAAMRRHGLANAVRVITGDYTEESGARAAREFLDSNSLPTAVLAGNDRCAIGMLGAFSRLGVNVPGDVSIVGYDDSEPARLSYIDLTSVRQDAPRMGELAIAALAERLDEGRTENRDIVLDPTLIVRSSTGRPRDSL